MNPLHQIVRTGHCRDTHQLFAIDALRLVQTDAGKRLTSWLLRYYRRYLRGAIDPDIRIRDFQNQMIHVQDGFWGGAPRVAHQWYDRLQSYLRQQRFSPAAHAAGVLSHYFTDPIQPLNTAYSSAEEAIHRPLQWSIQRDYQAIYRQWREDDLRVVFQLADGPGWLGAAMLHGAKYSRQRFEYLVDSYQLDAAANNPSAGIDSQMRAVLAEYFGLAITGWARVLERAASDAEAVMRQPLPQASTGWPLITATARVPAAYWRHRIQSRMEDQEIQELVAEFRRTGRLEEHLPVEVDIKKRVITVYRNERRYRLNRKRRSEQGKREQAELRSIPITSSIPPTLPQPIESLAIEEEDLKRLWLAGIRTVDDLTGGDPAKLAEHVQAYWITAETVGCWQRQALLMRQVKGLTAIVAKLLVGAGFSTATQIDQADIDTIHEKVVAFAGTTQGRRSLQRAAIPTRQQVSLWVRHIKSSVPAQTGLLNSKAA